MKIKIKLSHDHIDNGVKASCDKCPAALAIREQTKSLDVEVGDHRIAIKYTNGEWFNYRISKAVRDFIWKFDKGMPVRPINFYLSNPMRGNCFL